MTQDEPDLKSTLDEADRRMINHSMGVLYEINRSVLENLRAPLPWGITRPKVEPPTLRQRFSWWRGKQWWRLHDLMFGEGHFDDYDY